MYDLANMSYPVDTMPSEGTGGRHVSACRHLLGDGCGVRCRGG